MSAWCSSSTCLGEVARRTLLPDFALGSAQLMTIVAIFGTTISPYLFFWQAAQEVEELQRHGNGQAAVRRRPSRRAAGDPAHPDRHHVGMAFSNLIALFIIVAAAATLHAHGVTDIADVGAGGGGAAADRRAVRRSRSSRSGIIGTGLLAVPVLAGSAAYAVGEALRWPVGLGRQAARGEGVLRHDRGGDADRRRRSTSRDLDPISALFWARWSTAWSRCR